MRRVLVWFLVLVFVVGGVVGEVLDTRLVELGLPSQEGDLPTFFGFLTFALVGALLVLKARGAILGWIMLVIPTLALASLALVNYAIYADRVQPLPGMLAAAWLSSWTWFPTLALLFGYLPLLFPNGRLPSRRWRWVAYGLLVGTIFMVAATALVPGDLDVPGGGIRNPIELAGARGFLDVLTFLGSILFVGGSISCGASLFFRFRRARGEERLQVKWFTYAVALNIVLIILGDIFEEFEIQWLFGASISLLPLAIAVAVLKYRLYDIDVIVNRTLVYAVLTAVLVAAYGGGVLLFRTLLDPITGDNDLAIAASTLAVAALFGPARRRIQTFIDRRFYRSRYDARRTLDDFAARLRDEVDLDALSGDVISVVAETVHPRHVSVWLAGDGIT